MEDRLDLSSHVLASGLETAQAVTPFFNMFLLFDVSGHWGGGCVFLLSVQNSGEYISTMFGCV